MKITKRKKSLPTTEQPMRKEQQSSTKTAEGKLQQVVAEKDGDVIFGKISAVGGLLHVV